MKISSASKKVLASALSAAMVVAFAPTVAFGATGDKIAVSTDINGGTGTVPTFGEAVVGGKLALPTDVTFGTAKYALDGWYYDANEDGKITQGNGDKKWTSSDVLPDQESISFKAYYNVPSITKNAISFTDDGTDQTIKVPLTSKLAASKDFKVSLYGTDGHLLGTTATFGLATTDTAAVEFSTNAAGTGTTGIVKQISASDVKAGEYTIKLIDSEDEVVSTETFTLYEITQIVKTGSQTQETKSIHAKGDVINLSNYWKNAAGEIVTGNYKITGTDTLTKVDSSKGLVCNGSYSGRVMQFVAATPATDAAYVLTVKDPNGTEVYKKNIAKGTSSVACQFSFDSTATAYEIAAATEVAGTYTATLTQTIKGGDGELDTVNSISTNLVLTEIKYEAGENTSFKDGVTAAQKDVFTDDGADSTVTAIGNLAQASNGYTLADAWQLNGKALSNSNKLVAGATNVLSATAKAVDVSKKIATPALESVTKETDGEYTVKLSCATAGAKILYTTGAGDPATAYDATKGIEDVAKTATIKAIAVPVDGATPAALTENSLTLTLTPAVSDDNVKAYKGIVKDGALEYYVGQTTTKWAAVDSISAAVTAGNTAVDAVVFDTAKNLKSLTAAQAKGVYDAVLAEAKAQLAAYEGDALVVIGDKAYTISAKSLKSAKDAIAAMEAYVEELGTKATAADYKTAVEKYVVETNKALKKAEEADVTASDIAAAAEVTAQLTSTDAATAEAGLAAYAALTDAQKQLVAAADVAAAQKVVDEAKAAEEAAKAEEEAKKAAEEAAAALAAQQDQAAVNYVNSTKSKTVKLGKAAKTKKAATITWKSKVSASGNVVTYAWKSGSKSIKIDAAGTATLKKGVKAGTYKAKVSVACGSATRTVNVKFIVK